MDRLIEIWEHNNNLQNSLLIIAGKETETNKEFLETYSFLKKDVQKYNNIFITERRINDDEANFLLSRANIVVIPYRHASMSGVVFTAADFAIPIIATNTGAIGEYLNNTPGAFVCDNNKKALEETIINCLCYIDNGRLKELGKQYKEYIYHEFSWDTIVQKLINECYKK